VHLWCALNESSCLGMQLKMGGEFHLKLNIGERPIANKYRGKDEKNFGKRVKQYVKLLKGKRLKSVALSRNQPWFSWVYFLVNGPASVLTGGERSRECGIFGCVIALGRMHRLGLRNSARRKAGVRPRSCECLGGKPEREMKVKVRISVAESTDAQTRSLRTVLR